MGWVWLGNFSLSLGLSWMVSPLLAALTSCAVYVAMDFAVLRRVCVMGVIQHCCVYDFSASPSTLLLTPSLPVSIHLPLGYGGRLPARLR